MFLFDSYELVRNRPGLNQIKVLVASNDYGADLCAKRNCYGCFTSSKMDRLVYWSVFPGLRRRLRITARCKAVCDGIVILRTAPAVASHGARKAGMELAGRHPLRNRRAALCIPIGRL